MHCLCYCFPSKAVTGSVGFPFTCSNQDSFLTVHLKHEIVQGPWGIHIYPFSSLLCSFLLEHFYFQQ
uniref:Uncharacterized protein n=1 Tax=Aegilops tauschii subsp. strangulata TaxID=200361 RepID=A0A453SAL3_AEGTS